MKKKLNPILRGIKDFLPYFATPAMLVFLIWTASQIKELTFDNQKQKHDIISAFEDSPSPAQQAVNRILDSIADDTHIKNDEHAMKTRQARYEDGVRKDSIKNIKDSLFIDMITRQTVQIQQMKISIDSINLHH